MELNGQLHARTFTPGEINPAMHWMGGCDKKRQEQQQNENKKIWSWRRRTQNKRNPFYVTSFAYGDLRDLAWIQFASSSVPGVSHVLRERQARGAKPWTVDLLKHGHFQITNVASLQSALNNYCRYSLHSHDVTMAMTTYLFTYSIVQNIIW